jgi:hypothetical protein
MVGINGGVIVGGKKNVPTDPNLKSVLRGVLKEGLIKELIALKYADDTYLI